MKTLGKLLATGAMIAAPYLANPSASYAQAQDTTRADTTQAQRTLPNTIYSRCPEYSVTGEGILLKDFVFSESGSERNINEVFRCLYSRQGALSYDSVETTPGLEAVLANLRSDRTPSPEKRASIRYIQELQQTAPEDHTYMVFARSPSVEANSVKYTPQSIGILVYTPERRAPAEPAEVAEPEVPEVPVAPPVVVPPMEVEPEVPRVEKPKIPYEKRKRVTSAKLTLEGFLGEDGFRGAGIGVGYGAFGVSVNYAQADDRLVDSLSVLLSRGRVGTGREDETSFKALGVNVELHPFGPFFVYGGIGPWSSTTRIQESILSAQGDTLKTVTNSKTEDGLSYRYGAGLELFLGRLGFRTFAGNDTDRGKFGGVGLSVRLKK